MAGSAFLLEKILWDTYGSCVRVCMEDIVTRGRKMRKYSDMFMKDKPGE